MLTNAVVHLTSKEIWAKDKNRVKLLESKGYNVNIIWEDHNNESLRQFDLI